MILIGGIYFCLSPEPAWTQPNTFLGKSAQQWKDGLSSKDEQTRRNAAFALGRLGNGSAAYLSQLLQLATSDQSPKVRDSATSAIGEICRDSLRAQRHPEVVPTLKKALTDADPMVRRSAAFALGCLGSFGAAAIPDLDRALRDNSPQVRQNAAWALGFMGKDSVQSLQQALQDQDALVLRDSAASLAKLGPEAREALQDLVRCVRHPDVEVKKAALSAVVQMVMRGDSGQVIQPLLEAVHDANLEVRRQAALALGNIGGESAAAAVPVLVEALENAKVDMRRQAAAAIRNIGPEAEGAIPTLRRALADEDTEVRRNAAVALGGIAQKAQSAVPDLVHLLADTNENDEVRKEAAVALSRIGKCREATEAIPKLIDVISNSRNHADVRAVTLWALRVHEEALAPHEKLFTALNNILLEPKDDANKLLRYDAAFLLGVYKRSSVDTKVLDTLLEFLEDEKVIIYTGTATKVTGGGTEVGGGTADVQKEGRGDGRVMAVHALEWIGRNRVRERKDIMAQLRRIADNPNTFSELRTKAEKVWKTYSQ